MADHERDPEPGDLGPVFDELEAEFEAELQREAEDEAAAAVAAQVGEVPLWEHLSRRIGGRLSVRVGGLRLDGILLATYPDFVAVRTADGRQHLVRLGPETSIGLGPRRAQLGPPSTGEVARRYGLRLALRELARRREPVRVTLAEQGMVSGTIEVVGQDYLEIAEHDLGEARRRDAVTGYRLLPLEAVRAVTLPREPPPPTH
jgi:hypothetical protein